MNCKGNKTLLDMIMNMYQSQQSYLMISSVLGIVLLVVSSLFRLRDVILSVSFVETLSLYERLTDSQFPDQISSSSRKSRELPPVR